MFIRIFAISLFTIAAVVSSAKADNTLVGTHIQSLLQQQPEGGTLRINDIDIASHIVLPALYEKREFQPVWGNELSVVQYFEILGQIDDDGLNASDYHSNELSAIRERLWQAEEKNPSLRAEYDILLTDSLVRLGYHLLIGKVDPVELDSQWNMDTTIGKLDMILSLARAIEVGRMDELIDTLRPQFHIYANLKSALIRYRQIAAAGGWKTIQTGPTLKPGVSDPRVASIRQRLMLSSDYSGEDQASVTYDAALVEAVMKFQYRHGMQVDGLVGNETIRTMNIPVQAKIEKIKVNLERARWVLHDLPEKFVLVDIAGFTVSYYRHGKVIWNTRAQVGQPFRKTPIFKSNIRYLVLNPTWTVPRTILEEDILPKIHQDPEYLKRKNLSVLDFNGQPIDVSTIDWSAYPQTSFPYMLRQDAGPGGALGRIKFMFPNEFSVYLHDTPYRSLFDNNERAFSSGCIRIEKPYELSELLLDNPKKWNTNNIVEAIDSLQTTHVSLPQPVTIILFYWTTSVDENGYILFKPDIYERDAAISKGLASHFRFRDKPVFDIDALPGKSPLKIKLKNSLHVESMLQSFSAFQ